MKADFSGYATRHDVKCTDGVTIKRGAFKHNDQKKVPLVWQHQHNDSDSVLGHAYLEDRDDGVYVYGTFNKNAKAQNAREMVEHGDVTALSIFANQLRKRGDDVVHGNIREVSLVLAGANSEAFIDNVTIRHGDNFEVLDDEAIIYNGFNLMHGDDVEDLEEEDEVPLDEILATLTDEQREGVRSLVDDALKKSKKSLEPEEAQEVFESLDDAQQVAVHFIISEALAHADQEGATMADENKDETVQDVIESMTDKQRKVMYFLMGDESTEDKGDLKQSDHVSEELTHSITSTIQEGITNMANIFEKNGEREAAGTATLSHSQLETIVATAKTLPNGSFKEAVLMHKDEYGITDINLLFPDAKALSNTPELLSRRMEWVSTVLGGTKHSPFAKIKSLTADITAEEARAKGYIKGNLKKDEVVKMLRRTTGPATIYKKQKLDRDDILDITDLDVVAWLKAEIRLMLEEEIARAILVGDGRDSLSEDKIKDPEGAADGTGIRSILHDHPLYTITSNLQSNSDPKDTVKGLIRSRTKYRGTGKPVLYIGDEYLTEIMLLEDKLGRALYETEQVLADKLRVSKIITVDLFDEHDTLLAIMVNLADYTVGANKGGQLTSFEDFDIDYNQMKYLMETRISGALTKPHSAIVVRREKGKRAIPVAPSFNGPTNTLTIPTIEGIEYMIGDGILAEEHVLTQDSTVEAVAKDGYYIPIGTQTSWFFNYTVA